MAQTSSIWILLGCSWVMISLFRFMSQRGICVVGANKTGEWHGKPNWPMKLTYHKHGIQVLPLAAWVLLCLKVGHEAMVRMKEFPISHDKFFYEAYLYYNPMFLMSMMVWLWGLNMYGFLEARIPYAKVFDLEYDHLTHHDIWKIASCMTVVVLTSMTAYLYFYSQNMILEAALQPILLYVLMSVLLWLPSNVLYMRTRFDFLRTIVRLTFPIQTVSFAESLMADVLTSLAKPISDMERSICRMYHHQVATGACLEADAVCGGHSIYTPCILAFPYFSRFLQCLRQYRDTKDEMFLHNALKYATTSAIIFLPVLKYHVAPELWVSQVKPLWLMCTVLNSCCLFYWDITNDWEFGFTSTLS